MLKQHRLLQRLLSVVTTSCNRTSHHHLLQTTSIGRNLTSSCSQNMAAEIHNKSYNDAGNPVTAYILENSLREPEFLLKLREETMKLPRGLMLVDPVEAQFLRLLVGAAGAKRCIEIGTFTGYNACSIAHALPHDGEVIACDVEEKNINTGKPFWDAECLKKIKIKIAPATETLDNLIKDGQTGQFDFVFIDADKANYDAYYEKSLVLLKQGGIIAVDNSLWSGRVTKDEAGFDADTKALHNLNKKIKQDERVDISFLQVGDGTFLCRKK